MFPPQLTSSLLLPAAGVALASLVVSALGVTASLCARRSAPLRHALLLCSVLVLSLLPAAVPVATHFKIGWTFAPFERSRPSSTVQRAGGKPKAESGEPSAIDLADGVLPADGPVPASHRRGGMRVDSGQRTAHSGWPNADHGDRTADLGGERTVAAPAETAIPTAHRTAGTAVSKRLVIPSARAFGAAAVALWLAGAVVSLLRAARAALRIARHVRRARPLEQPQVAALLDELASGTRLRRTPRLRSSEAVPVPFAWGLVRPVIVLPQHLLAEPAVRTLRPVLLHELAHIARHDAWIGCLQRAAAAMYWWNPLVHVLNRRLADAREQLCDTHVLAGGWPPRDYAEVLVELASHVAFPQQPIVLGLLSRCESQLTRRVQHLLQEDGSMSTSLPRLSKILVVGFVLILCAAAVASVVRPAAEESAAGRMGDARPAASRYFFPAVDVAAAPSIAATPGLGAVADAVVPVDDSLGIAQAPLTADEVDPFAAGPFSGRDELQSEPFAGTDEFSPTPVVARGRGGPGLAARATAADEAAAALSAAGMAPAQPGAGLVIIQLLGNDDGSLKELRWFTESLGTGEQAYQALTSRIAAFAPARPLASAQPKPARTRTSAQDDFATPGGTAMRADGAGGQPGRVLQVQITADPQLRYEHVARVIAICEPHADRVEMAQPDVRAQFTFMLGFVRDANGRKVSSSPVLIWNEAPREVEEVLPDGTRRAREVRSRREQLVPIGELARWLAPGLALFVPDPTAQRPAAVLHTDPGVPTDVVQRVVQQLRAAGIERVVLRSLAESAPESVQAVVTEIMKADTGTRVRLSVGMNDGVAVGWQFAFFPPAPENATEPVAPQRGGTLVAEEVGLDSTVCRLEEGSPEPSVGTKVVAAPK